MTSRQRSWLLPPAALALIAGILIGRGTPSPAFALVACLPVLAAILLGKGILRFVGCLLLSLAIGTAAGSLAWHPSLPPPKVFINVWSVALVILWWEWAVSMDWSGSTESAAAAAKSLQSRPTLCDPMDCSPPGSSVHGILQARVLEWGAIAFSD